jgi:hypothetical protein
VSPAIAARVRGRGSAAVVSGAVAYGAGILRVFSFLVVTGLEVSLAASGPIDGRIALGSSPAAVPAAVLGLGLFHLVGLPWLSFGMVRTRQLLLIAAVVATVGTVCAFFGSTRIETVGWVVSGLALAYIGTVFRPRVPQALSVGSGSLTPPAPDRRPLRERAGRHRARPRHRPPLIETDPASTRGP